jgi:ribonuclease HI
VSGRNPPLLADILRALVETTPLDAAAARLGLTAEELRTHLISTAAATTWRRPGRVEPPKEAPPTESAPVHADVLVVFCDGAARNNPGPAGAGAVVRTTDGRIVARLGKFLGVQTNNVAEYEGLILGVSKAAELGAREVHVFADSLLVISQLRGEWKVKHPGLRPLYDRAKVLLGKFDRVKLAHVPREQNGDADEMSNRAIDERM